MAEVMNMPVDSLEPRGDREEADDPQSLSPPPPPPPAPAPSKQRFRRDDRDSDRPPNRRGDYYDRSKSPMAPPPLRDRQRNRDRDYKRRSSISPPPPPYRDRRHSPPPPYKRSRREDGGYGGRRGGFGPGDRRFGYDYGGGYEREMGGRGYGDERPHGRYVAHSFGPPEWDSGRGGFGEASGMGNTQREGLMSYKQFIQELEDDILPSEAEPRYQEYKSEYISTQKQAFFSAHKDEGWFKDKYHPTNLLAVVERRNELARKLAKDFLLDLQSGTLDLGPGINASSSNKSGQASDPNSEDEGDGGKRKWHGSTPTSGTDLSAAPKAHRVSTDPRRIQVDIEQAQDLVCKLDSEKQIEENILCGSDNDKMNRERSHAGSTGPVIIIRGLKSIKGLEGVELLDTLITYLWRIHGLDYYGMIEKSECKGLRHVRVEGKSFDIASNGEEWEKKLDSHWQERLQSPDPVEVMTAKEKIDAAAAEALDPHVRKIRDEKYGWKYGCGAKSCTKLFHAADFVRKHLKLKHPELVMELTVKVREELYFQNYMNDADAPGGTPVMQQSGLRDPVRRHRFGADTRLKDDRGNRRDQDNLASGSERFDNLRPGEFQSNSDGSDGGNLDNTVYDAFGEQGLHVGPPFPSDISTPPVLMPVPGAGPLGPFVPAPPEVAMRMLREQGGPPPFEVDGRNSRSEPQLSGPTPMLALSPALQQDPRRLRSYQDLDAPEDEVTVIDYRSL